MATQMGKQSKGKGKAEAAIRSSVPPAALGQMPVLGIQHATSPLTAEQIASVKALRTRLRISLNR
jgi:hypothetical protein